MFVNGVEIYKFKARDSETNAYPLCLGNVLKEFLAGYDSIDVDDILHIHKYLMKKNDIK